MFLDKITESIAFFIGLFQLVTEAVLGRQEYESFKHDRDAQTLEAIRAAARDFEANYGPEGYDTAVSDVDIFATRPQAPDFADSHHVPESPEPKPVPEALTLSDTASLGVPVLGTPGAAMASITLRITPSSIAEFTVQQNILFDRDSVNTTDKLVTAWTNLQEQLTAHATQQATALQVLDLSPFGVPAASPAAAAENFAEAVAQASEAVAELFPVAEVAFARGSAVEGITSNGETVSDMSDWKSMLPELPERSGGEASAFYAGSAGDPHTLLTGGNLAQNMVSAVSTGVDAALILVLGDAVSLDAISQVNVLRDDAARPQHDNTMLNEAAFSGQPTVMTGANFGTSFGNAPFMNVTTLTGDLVHFNWTEQVNFIGDEDTLNVTFSGWESWLSTGENQLVNAEALVAPRMAFDLIIVEGDMTTQYLVSQTNVLADEDGLPQSFQATAEGTPFGAPETSDNTMINLASIGHTARDQLTILTEGLRDILENFDPDSPNLPWNLLPPVFGEIGGLNVLHITGDLLKMHALTQVNILSDGDLVTASPDGLGQHTVAGGNATVNVAALTDVGIGSIVMAGGSVYSDAVLHQANLVSEDAPPSNVTLLQENYKALATEAVAFLSDDMAAGQQPADIGSEAASAVATEGLAHSDVMQTMLA